MADRLDPDVLFARGFKAGSIVRLKMKNFLTYDECEVFTGPRLNIVIGPNGTGKSALTHAICLACCGSTSDVGRSNDLSKFVKHGSEGEEAYAEVDILTAERSLMTIRRVINSENKGSKWFMNGRPAKQAEVKAFVTSLSIDVDNLCSFMPQDRVGAFSRFTPKEILSNTLKSIQAPDEAYNLFTEQHELSNIQDNKEDYRRKRDAKQTSLDTHQRDLDSMRAEMARMERREELQSLLKDYVVRLMAVEVQELCDRCDEKQEDVNQRTARLQEEKQRLAPLEQRERDLRRQQAGRNKAYEDAKDMQHLIDDALRKKKDALQQCEVDVDNMGNDLILVATTRADKERERQKIQDQLNVLLQEERDTLAVMPGIQKRLSDARADVAALTEQYAAEEDRAQQLTELGGQLRDEIITTKREMAGLQDFKQQYRQRLAQSSDQYSRGALAVLDWLGANEARLRQHGQLRGEVVGPVAMYCSVADPACAVMLEKAVPLNRWMGFIVDNDEDAAMLKQARIQHDWKVDIFTMKNPEIDQRRGFSEHALAAMGLKGYLADQLDCPDVVRAFLYSFNNLHKVLWGRGADSLSMEHQRTLCQQEGRFLLYLHEVVPGRAQQSGMTITEYRGNLSRNRNLPPSTSSIGVAGKGLLKAGGEDTSERRGALQSALREAEMKLRQGEQQLAAQQNVTREVSQRLQSRRGDMHELVKASKNPALIKQKVANKQKALDEVNQQLAVNAGRERQEKAEMYRKAIENLLAAVREMALVLQKANAHRVDREVANALRDELADAVREAATELQEAQRVVKDLTRELAQAEKQCNDLRRKKEDREEELDAHIQQTGRCHSDFAVNIYEEIKRRCPEETVDAVQARIDQLNEDINRIADNPQLQQRFEEVTQKVAQLQEDVKKATEDFEHAEEALTERARRWQTLVTKTTEKLNLKFGAYMRELDLDGEVKLKNVGRFCDYELQLRVKFRAASDFSELDGSKHSGGERAVSTVMFLMALQDMTTSPFRVVDEINQGMDEANERLVFERIIKSCCGDASKPQYFLVTPKLLQGLGAMRNDDVTVLLVWNGPGTGTKWVFSDLLETLSQGANGGARASAPAASTSSTAAPAARDVKIKADPGAPAAAGKRSRPAARDGLESDAEDSQTGAGRAGQGANAVRRGVVVKKQKQ